MFDLTEKAFLIVGGAGYLCQPAVEVLLQKGARVLVADRNAGALMEMERRLAAGEFKDRVDFLHSDAGDEAAALQSVDRTREVFGRLDGLVVATFRSIGGRLEDLTPAGFDEANHINLTGTFILARAAAQKMPQGGSIVLFSSMYGLVAPDKRVYEAPMCPNPIEYGVAKAGITQMARYLAQHYGDGGIRVNAIAPGPFPHDETQKDTAFAERLAQRTMLRRLGKRPEIAGTVLYLLSEASSYVTGQVISVDGGWTAW